MDDLEGTADSIGHIETRRVVDAYARCAVKSKKQAAAKTVYKRLLDLYKERSVVESAITDLEKDINNCPTACTPIASRIHQANRSPPRRYSQIKAISAANSTTADSRSTGREIS